MRGNVGLFTKANALRNQITVVSKVVKSSGEFVTHWLHDNCTLGSEGLNVDRAVVDDLVSANCDIRAGRSNNCPIANIAIRGVAHICSDT